MSDLGQAEFKSLEAAVRDRLKTWTEGVEGLHFAVLDYPSTLERTLSQQLLETTMNEALEGNDPGRERLDYLYALDKVVNPVLVGGETVAPKTETISKVYGDILKFAQPLPKRLSEAETAELEMHRGLLYDQNPETGLLDTSPALAIYQNLSLQVMEKTIALQQAQAEHGPDSVETRLKQQELSFAQTDLLVRGQKNRIEEAQARIIQLSTNSTELWQRALLDYEDSLLLDAETTDLFPASRCPPVPASNWMKVDLDMQGKSTGAVLGMNEKLLRLEAEMFLVPIDRNGWMQRNVLTNVPWKWGIMGRSGKLSDGIGGGDLPYLPQHLVLMRDIKLTVQIPFESDGSMPAAQLPKIGRMAIPLQVSAVNGRQFSAPVQMRAMTAVRPKVAAVSRAGDLRQMRTEQLMQQRIASRSLMEQIATVQRKPKVMQIAPIAPKLQRTIASVHSSHFEKFVGAMPVTPTTKPVSEAEINRAVGALNNARRQVAHLERERKELLKHKLVRTLRKRKLDKNTQELNAANARVRHADKALKDLRAQKARYEEEQRRIAQQRREEEERRRAEQERKAAEEARRRAPSSVAINIQALEGDDWKGRRVRLSIREAAGRVTNAQSNDKGEVRENLKPGRYTARIVQGVEADENTEEITFECAMGEPVSQVIAILPKWQTVELKACEAGEEVLLFGYLLQALPELPQEINLADIDTHAPDLV